MDKRGKGILYRTRQRLGGVRESMV